MKSLRQTVSEQMVQAHGITPELADYHVSQMDAAEVIWCFKNYICLGAELSAAGPTQKSCPDFYQVFGSATTTADLRPSTAFPEGSEQCG